MNAHDAAFSVLLPAVPDGHAIRASFLADERITVGALAAQASLDSDTSAQVVRQARTWVEGVRARQLAHAGIESFLQQYDLSTQEGVLLMCVAEALLRIPDAQTADALIRDKLSRGDWERHLGASGSLLVNASTWGLMLTGRMTRLDAGDAGDPAAWYQRLVARAGEPVVRVAVRQAMKVMAEQFVMGRTIDEALDRSIATPAQRRCRHSYDMLGEAALTSADARRYRDAYAAAIAAIGARRADASAPLVAQPSISVKLSALHPRFEYAQRARVQGELVPIAQELARLARDAGIGLTLDAEESDRLELSLEIFARLRADAGLRGYEGLGLAVQAYQKRARAVVSWIAALARGGERIPVRLVKGAYWDTEIKRAQVQGLANYPVFTRKSHTDVSYLACARALLDSAPRVYPMFATHNAHTIAWVAAYAHRQGHDLAAFEFQRLHGMGEALYDQVIGPATRLACRVYAPVGSHRELLPYLVRRLLENGANTSFVNRIGDASVPVDDVVADPLAKAREHDYAPARGLPLPRDLYAPERENAAGVALADQDAMAELDRALQDAAAPAWVAAPLLARSTASGTARILLDPSDQRRSIGTVVDADATTVARALETLSVGQPVWNAQGGSARAEVLDRAAAILERERNAFVALLAREAGKTRPAALAEVREAVDFCRYYAARARAQFDQPLALPSPTGETNSLSLHGRGVFACISPWNFPLAIFTGQVAAALAAGNAVAAKPAEQTPLTAAYATACLHEGGVPADVLALLPGDGDVVGAALVADPRVAGVAFTGSTDVASRIARVLATRAPIVPLIAETGGQNAMLVDSSALPEQVVQDALVSAFDSAGQRCSALRVLCVQEDIAPRVLELLHGAMDELVVGDPAQLRTDVGPVIDAAARAALELHIATLQAVGLPVHRVALPPETAHGMFVAPALVELDRLDRLDREVFGPVLHVLRFRGGNLDALVEAINAFGYGLTLGIHSRIDATVARVVARARVGNLYVNRNMIGAVVGMQPFGGERLSGTGPKAGGPHYLPRFAVERTLSINTAAAGGNATLLAQGDA